MLELNVFIVYDNCWLVFCIQIFFGIVVIDV